jgi:hypothetical protein
MRKQYRSGPAGQAIPCIPRTLNFGLCRVQQMPMAVHPGSCITGHVLVLFSPRRTGEVVFEWAGCYGNMPLYRCSC